MKIAAIDIGGTRIKSCLFDGDEVKGTNEVDTNAKGGAKAVLEAAASSIEGFLPVDCIGISTAGQVDPESGTIIYANENLPGYTGTKVKAYFEERFGIPCFVMNDAYAAALGEGSAGAARGYDNFICVTYGTGIGGGVFIDGKAYYGKGGSANLMIGGLITHPECVSKEDAFAGSYERFASTTALVNRAKKVDPSLDNGKKIFAAKDRKEVQAVIDAWLDEIAYGLLSILHLYNVPIFVLGGGVMEQESLLKAVEKRIHTYAIPGFEKVKIVSAKLGNQAGVYGAKANAQACMK